jgi:hypothetical protein
MIYAIVGLVCLVVGFAAGFGVASAMQVAPGAVNAISAAANAREIPMRGDDVLRANVKDVRTGGLIALKGFGDDFEDVDMEIERCTKFVRGPQEWHVLEGSYRNRPVGLAWQETGGKLSCHAHKHLDKKTLTDVGLAAEALDGMSEGAAHSHDGVDYTLRGAGKTFSHKDGTGFGKELKTWEFASGDGLKSIRVSRKGEQPHQVSLGEDFDAGALIEIYKVKA